MKLASGWGTAEERKGYEMRFVRRRSRVGFDLLGYQKYTKDATLGQVYHALACLREDPSDFVRLVPHHKISGSVYLHVTHPLVGFGEEDRYLLEFHFEKDSPEDFRHFRVATSDLRYVVGVITKYFERARLPSLRGWRDVTAILREEIENADLIDAHTFSTNHRSQLAQDTVCGCFNCGKIFSPQEIQRWIEDPGDETAVCPYCGINAVIGESCGYPITPEFLARMRRYWFF